MITKETKRHFLRFLVVGGVSTLINYVVYYVCFHFYKIDLQVSYGIGFFTGVLVGFIFNKLWTYESKVRSVWEVIKYYIVYILSFLLGLVILKGLVNGLGFNADISNLGVIGITMMTNFIGTKFWVFNNTLKNV